VTRYALISDELWAVIEPVLPSGSGRRGRPWADHRRVLEGIIWRYRVGAPWRDLPCQFGPFQTVWKRHHRWSLDGTYAAIFRAVQQIYGPGSALAAVVEQIVSVDSTSVRAHQHAAGAPKAGPTASPPPRGVDESQDSAGRAA
jgi:putative transposase